MWKKRLRWLKKRFSNLPGWKATLDKRRNWRLEARFLDEEIVCDLHTIEDRWEEVKAILRREEDQARFLFLYGNQALLSPSERYEFHRLREKL